MMSQGKTSDALRQYCPTRDQGAQENVAMLGVRGGTALLRGILGGVFVLWVHGGTVMFVEVVLPY